MGLYGRGCSDCGFSGRIHIGGGVNDACPSCFELPAADLSQQLSKLKEEFIACRDALACAVNLMDIDLDIPQSPKSERLAWLEGRLARATKVADSFK